MNFHGPVIGSPIQSGSPGAHQEVSMGDLDLGAVREFIDQFDTQAADLELPSPAAEELAAEIDTVKAQLRSPKPKLHVIRESLLVHGRSLKSEPAAPPRSACWTCSSTFTSEFLRQLEVRTRESRRRILPDIRGGWQTACV